MGKKSIPAPDPRIAAAAEEQARLGREYLDFQKQQMGMSESRQKRLDARADMVAAQQMDIAKRSEDRADDQWDRYQTTFAPIEDELAAQARDAGGAADQERAAGEVSTDYNSALASAKESQNREMLAMGVNPGSARFAAMQSGTALKSAADRAGLLTRARTEAKDRGINMKSGVLNIGGSLKAGANAGYGIGMNAGASALNASAVGNQYFQQRGQGIGDGYKTLMGSTADLASTYGQLHNNNVSAISAQNASRASITGAAIGAGAMFLSDPCTKENIVRVGDLASGLGLYEFNYKPEHQEGYGPFRFRGVMADEVEKIDPESVVVGSDGFKRVNYAKLGLRMERVGS